MGPKDIPMYLPGNYWDAYTLENRINLPTKSLQTANACFNILIAKHQAYQVRHSYM